MSGDDASRLGDTNLGATLEPGEPIDIGGTTAGASVWYRWTAPTDARSGSTRYTGSAVGSLTEIASNDDWNDVTSRVKFAITSGTTYRIRVDGYHGDTGARPSR